VRKTLKLFRAPDATYSLPSAPEVARTASKSDRRNAKLTRQWRRQRREYYGESTTAAVPAALASPGMLTRRRASAAAAERQAMRPANLSYESTR